MSQMRHDIADGFLSAPPVVDPIAIMSDEVAGAEYALTDSLSMTLKQLRLIATIVPIAAVFILEVVRYFVMGPVPIGKRELVSAAAAPPDRVRSHSADG